MAEVLLINRDDIMRLTGLNGNIDETKILPHVKTAQDIHLQPIIGTNLLDKCKELVEDDELDDVGNENYKTLVETYITPNLVYLVMWDAIPFLQYEIANGGIYQHNSENSQTPTKEEIDVLIQRFKDKAEFYGQRLSGYICENNALFPELSESSTGADLSADGQSTFSGWVI